MKMAKANFWKSDWFVGLIVSVIVLFLGNGDLLQSLERKAYDMAVAMTTRTPSDKVAVIAIDKQSIDNIGRWPWSREIMADMVEKLAAAKAKVIAPIIFYSEPQLDPGLVYVNKLMEACGLAPAAASAPDAATAATVVPPVVTASPSCGPIAPILQEAELKLNTDRRLADAFAKAGNVALPMLFRRGEPLGRPDKDLPDFVRKNSVKLGKSDESSLIPTADVDASVIEPLGDRKSVV